MVQTTSKRKNGKSRQDHRGTEKDGTILPRAKTKTPKSCETCSKLRFCLSRQRQERGCQVILNLSPTQIIGGICKRHSELVSRYSFLDSIRIQAYSDSDRMRIFGEQGGYEFSHYSGALGLLSSSKSLSAPGTRVVNSRWADYGLPRRWKRRCDVEHACSLPESLSHLKTHLPLWVIDTWKQCLVQCSTSTPYVALSYVWGGTDTFTALQSNIRSLQNPGALAGDKMKRIPRTIRDAMAFVQILGERYLWVDSLCILQDDEQKMVEIANMGAIYAQASITIVAADGDNADAGLRGFHGMSGPRSVRQVVHPLCRGTPLVETYGMRGRTFISNWQTRGWTFQEELFSRRKVLFKQGWIRWACQEAIWDKCGDTSKPDSSIFNNFVPRVDQLVRVFLDFNRRSLTFPEDALLAFSGIASALASIFQGGFISGFPVSVFYVGLLWDAPFTVKRRVPKKPGAKYCLPSWSWAGWQGNVRVQIRGNMVDHVERCSMGNYEAYQERVSSLVDWSWTNEIEGPQTRIYETWQNHREAFWNRSDTPCPPGWTRYPIDDPSSTASWQVANHPHKGVQPLCFYKHKSEPDSEFRYPPPMPREDSPTTAHILAKYITCRTRRGWLLSGNAIIYSPSPQMQIISLRDQEDNWAGALKLHEPLYHRQEDGSMARAADEEATELELVEIAQGSVPNDTADREVGLEEWVANEQPTNGTLYEYFYVLWIEWKEGIAYRKGIGRVHKNAWEAQQPEWIDLVLG